MSLRISSAIISLIALGFYPLLTERVQRALEEYITRSCECEVTISGFEIDWSSLSAGLAGLVVTREGERELAVDSASIDLDVTSLRRREVTISEIVVSGGFVRGVGGESVLGRLIRGPPNRGPETEESDGFVTIELDRIQVNGVRVVQPIGADELLDLGTMAGRVRVQGDGIAVEKLTLSHAEPWVELTGAVRNEELSGTVRYDVSPAELGLGGYVRGGLEGRAEISGTLDRPRIEGTAASERELVIPALNESLGGLRFDAVRASYTAALEDGEPNFRLSELVLTGPAGTITAREPIVLSGGEIGGVLGASLPTLSYGGIRAQRISAEARISGAPSRPDASIRLDAGELELGSETSGALTARAELDSGSGYAELRFESDRSGELRASGEFDLGEERELHRASLVAEELVLANAIVDGAAVLRGGAELAALHGEGEFTVGPAGAEVLPAAHETARVPLPWPAEITFTLERGIAHTRIEAGELAHGEARIDLTSETRSQLTLNLPPLDIGALLPGFGCGELALGGRYLFLAAAPAAGDGELLVERAVLGCIPPLLELRTPERLEIRNGELDLGALTLTSGERALTARGTLSPERIDASLEGSLSLEALSPLVSGIDDLAGIVEVDLSAAGTPAQPEIAGFASVRYGTLAVSTVPLLVERVNGAVRLSDGTIAFDGLSGVLNDGTFELTGAVALDQAEQSRFGARFDNVSYAPLEELTSTLSGSLTLRGLGATPELAGEVIIEEALYEPDLSLRALAGAVQEALRGADEAIAEAPAAVEAESALLLDLTLRSRGEIYVKSDWAEAELIARLAVSGTADTPIIEGEVHTVYGWLELGQRRFEIVTGDLSIPESPLSARTAEVSLRAETEIIGPAYELAFVTMHVDGAVGDPAVTFTSDTEMTREEILRLVASGGSLQDLVDEAAGGLAPGFLQAPLEALNRVAGFDTLRVEPSVDIETGLPRPKLIVERTLTDELLLRGQQHFAETRETGEVSAVYNVTPRLDLLGGVVVPSGEEKNSLRGDVSYRLIPERRFLTIKLYGVDRFRRRELLDALRLSDRSRITAERTRDLEERLRKLYADAGFHGAIVVPRCPVLDESRRFCRRFELHVREGQRFELSGVRLRGDELGEFLEREELLPRSGTPASREQLEETERAITSALRRDGYLKARASARYELVNGSAELVLWVRRGPPLALELTGNEAFDTDELLELESLYERPYPFGPQSARALAESITEHYRRAGYPEAEAVIDFLPRRRAIAIHVEEGPRVTIDKVILDGPRFLTPEVVRPHLSGGQFEKIFSDGPYVAAQALSRSRDLARALRRAGFPEAAVAPELRIEEGRTVLAYAVRPGERRVVERLIVRGAPPDAKLPAPPEHPLSAPELDQYYGQIVTALQEAGYRTAEVRFGPPEGDAATILVRPGPLTRIGTIRVIGLESVDEAVVLRALELAPGDPWRRESINEANRRLRELGLFAAIELEPADGTLEEEREELAVRLAERNLRELSVGAGYDSEFGIHLFGHGTDRALLRSGSSFSLFTDVFYEPTVQELTKGTARLRYSDPFFAWSDYRFAEELSFRRLTRNTQEYDVLRTALSSVFSRSAERWNLSAGHIFQYEDLSNVPGDIRLGDNDYGGVFLSSLSGSANYDGRDDALNPERGFALGADLRLSTSALASDADFVALGIEGTVLRPITQRFSFAQVLRYDSSWAFWDTGAIPVSERYYLGGSAGMRGFRENSLGPRSDAGNIIGGDIAFLSSSELRYGLSDSFSVLAFLDLGNTFLRNRGDYELRESAGLGARYASPIGPVGFDVGMPLDERSGEPSIRFHLRIGGAF